MELYIVSDNKVAVIYFTKSSTDVLKNGAE